MQLKNNVLILAIFLFISCTSKKEILYFQDSLDYKNEPISYHKKEKVKPNDILDIKIITLIPEASMPYNNPSSTSQVSNSLDIMRINGYVVSDNYTIDFPVLGEINIKGLTLEEVETKIRKILEDGGHLVKPTVKVKLINAKVTIIGEVKVPGTYTYLDQNLNILQALGYAGDLTINGEREDVILIREVDGVRKIEHLNLTSTDILDSPYYYVKSNDVIVVNPNEAKVKSAGIIGNIGTFVGLASLALSIIVLVTR